MTQRNRANSVAQSDHNDKNSDTLLKVRMNDGRIGTIPRLNLMGKNFDSVSIASSMGSLRSFSATKLA